MTPVDREEDEDAELLPRLALTGLLSLGCLVVEVEADVEAAVGASVSVRLRWHRDVARAVDAGLLLARLPRPLRALGAVL